MAYYTNMHLITFVLAKLYDSTWTGHEKLLKNNIIKKNIYYRMILFINNIKKYICVVLQIMMIVRLLFASL